MIGPTTRDVVDVYLAANQRAQLRQQGVLVRSRSVVQRAVRLDMSLPAGVA
jgi:hypothetical protein